MARVARARLYDIDQTIIQLLAITRGRTQDDLARDWAFGQACNYALQTIGEAVNHLPSEIYERHPDIPWRRIVGLSHKVRHEYFRLDHDVIWEVIILHLPPLHATIQRIIADLVQPALPL